MGSPESMSSDHSKTLDYSKIIEFPRRKAGRAQVQVISRRYYLAKELAGGKRVLEAGCGAGFGLGCLVTSAKTLVAGDVTNAALRQVRRTYPVRPSLWLVQFDAQHLPFHDRSFDLVVALAMVYYVDLPTLLDQCRHVLDQQGLLLFCSPNPAAPGFKPSELSTRYYSVPELAKLAQAHGYALEVFGAFPAPRGLARAAEWLIAAGSQSLEKLMPVGMIREAVKEGIRRLIRYPTASLRGELTETHLTAAADIPSEALSLHTHDTRHRVLYCVARVSQ
jgi:SAM-dependent methyltransferase